jgi:hypothetical protein
MDVGGIFREITEPVIEVQMRNVYVLKGAIEKWKVFWYTIIKIHWIILKKYLSQDSIRLRAHRCTWKKYATIVTYHVPKSTATQLPHCEISRCQQPVFVIFT